MTPVAYTVIATLPDEPTADEYVRWLLGGHIRAVVEAGAQSGVAVRIQEPATPIRVEARYIFADQATLDRYIRQSAPALRAEGLRRFPPERGISFERRTGSLLGP